MDLDPESGTFPITSQPFSMPGEVSGIPDWYLEFCAIWALELRGPIPSVEAIELIPTYDAWLAAGHKGLVGDWARACCPDLGDVVSMAHAWRDANV